MTVTKEKNGSELTVFIAGRLDTVTAPELEAEMSGALDGVEKLTVDLSDLEYVSSAGLRVFLSLQKKMDKCGNMVVRKVNETVSEIFDITGFADILTIE
ncbi:MAG: STAS domain-containing protein [Clostridia bacterium]|nr:STAS domain-containing protein [Clostridia bacterium]